jgi:hypothetical protein
MLSMRRTATLLVLLAAAAPAARAATFAETTVEESARNADAVVRGVVVSTTSRLTRGGRRIVTDVEIAVTEVWKGATTDRTIRVVVPGGRVDGVALWVDTAPSFSPGEEVVVFLDRKGDAWGMSGAALGKYGVGGGEAHPAVGGADVLARPHPAGERAVGSMGVDELERRVRSAQ